VYKRQPVDGLVTDTQIGGDLGDGAASSHQVEHLAAEFFGVTLRHGHGSFNGRRDPKSSKPTPDNPGHISIRDLRSVSAVIPNRFDTAVIAAHSLG
jgi:hypothetical protein